MSKNQGSKVALLFRPGGPFKGPKEFAAWAHQKVDEILKSGDEGCAVRLIDALEVLVNVSSKPLKPIIRKKFRGTYP